MNTQISDAEFGNFQRFIFDAAGITLSSNKKALVCGRLAKRVHARKLSSYADYFQLLKSARDPAEVQTAIDLLTTNETYFFREPKHFDYLVGTVLPQMRDAGIDRLRVWSAACSTGAEPYTLAMLLDAFAQDRQGPDYGILATDLDSEVLRTARRGVYPAAMLDPVPAGLRARYAMRANDPKRGEMRIAANLRAAIGFAQMNLMDERYPVGDPMDIIFCRNVLIYFDKATQEKVVRRLTECLRPGGLLFLGHSESIAGFDLPLKTVANTVFARV